jgi:hypothetical protein
VQRAAPYVLAGWTVLIWIGRVRNILAAHGSVAELFVPLVLVLVGAATLVRPKVVGVVLAAVTAVVWLIRVPLLLVHDHSAAFVIVHIVLATVSLGLAWWTFSARRARRPATV